MQLGIHKHRATPDLAVAVEQHLALPADRLLFFGIAWIENIRPRLRQAVLDQNFSGELFEIARTF